MSVIVLSPHEESAAPLCSALERRRIPFRWTRDVPTHRDAPLVAVVDSKLEGYASALRSLRTDAPWCRRYVMDPPHGVGSIEGSAALHRPFDASLVAELLGRDRELALIDRKRIELEIEAQDLGELLQHSFEAFIGLDCNHQIISFSPGASEMYGYATADVLGKPITLLGDSLNEGVPQGGAIGQDKLVLETTRRHADGRELRVLVSRSRARNHGAKSPLAFTEVSLDVTHMRQLERQLEHQGRLAHLGRIAATMSHEINNPLSVIRSCAAWLGSYSKRFDTAELRETSRDLEIASERIATFVRQMSGFVRRTDDDMRLESLNGALEMALRMVRPRAADKNVQIALVDASAATRAIPHDAGRLAHAFINVIANAIDAAAEGGGHVWLWVTSGEESVNVRVADDGPGIAPAIREHLFEPFSTTKAVGHGTGLGLALTKEIVQEHAGTITLRPRDPRGVVALISLPLARKLSAGGRSADDLDKNRP
jgi:PAS domain S-box-containing protein